MMKKMKDQVRLKMKKMIKKMKGQFWLKLKIK
jgi:hypothetical protein